MEVLIGVDPHKATNVVAAVDEQGEVVGQENFPANRKGMRALERWAKRPKTPMSVATRARIVLLAAGGLNTSMSPRSCT